MGVNLRYRITTLFALTAIVAIVLWLSLKTMVVVEISTQDLSIRTYTRRTLFGYERPMENVTYRSTDFSKYLLQSKILQYENKGQGIEYVEADYEQSGLGGHGKAWFIYKTLYRDRTNKHWIVWSQKHPELAKKFWPCLVSLLQHGYLDEATTLMLYARIEEKTEDELFRLVEENNSLLGL